MAYFRFIKMDILKVVIQLSGHFVYPDDFAGNQNVQISEVRLYMIGSGFLTEIIWMSMVFKIIDYMNEWGCF
jgi:hypothetical protein